MVQRPTEDEEETRGPSRLAYECKKANRRHTYIFESQVSPAPEEPVLKLKRVAAGSNDYASLNEHVITNFAGFIRSINPEHPHLHNSPNHVHAQLERAFMAELMRYRHPAVTRTLSFVSVTDSLYLSWVRL